jgi:hypothetical protein
MKGYIPDPRRIKVVSEKMAAVLRDMTPAEKIEMCFTYNRIHRARLENAARRFHRDWGDDRVMGEVARRMLRRAMRED